MEKQCCESGCNSAAIARGFCGKHYMVNKRAGLLKVGPNLRGRPVEERFWKYVLKTVDCWLWQGGSVSQKGYGQIQLTRSRDRVLVHRLSYEIHHGPIPAGMVVMHTCDNPSCVNPAHLKTGTQSQNIIESFNKGRKICIPPVNFGEKHRSAKLNEDLVRLIRVSDKIHADLAKEIGVLASSISKARRRKTWKHIP